MSNKTEMLMFLRKAIDDSYRMPVSCREPDEWQGELTFEVLMYEDEGPV